MATDKQSSGRPARLLVVGGEVITMGPRGVVSPGTVVVEDGKIAEVVPAVLEAGPGEDSVDARGMVVTPGFIDVHTHLGVYPEGYPYESKDLNEVTNPVTAELDAMDGMWPGDIGFSEAVGGGVTCVGVMPGSANVIGGLGLVTRTWGRTAEEMVIQSRCYLKAALGINPKVMYGRKGKAPMTRMGIASTFRKAFMAARAYSQDRERKKEKGEHFNPDAGKEALCMVLDKGLPVRAHASRVDDLMTALRLCREQGLDLVIEHGYEAHLVADLLAEAGVGVALGPLMRTRGSSESQKLTFAAARILVEAGVTLAMMTDHPIAPVKYLPIHAALTTRYGLDVEKALATITINSARLLRLDHRLGSIEEGKDADLVVSTKHPFCFDSVVVEVLGEGQRIFHRREYPDVG